VIRPIYYFISLLGVGIAAILVLVFAGPEYLAFVNIIILAVLVVVTSQYADQTTKMAKEMENQRYDMVRPVIDFKLASRAEILSSELEDDLKLQFECETWIPDCHIFVFHNVGCGPAIDAHASVKLKNEPIAFHRAGTISTVALKYLMHSDSENDLDILIAIYKDIHDRYFKSSRTAIYKGHKRYILGPLEYTPISEEEYKNSIDKLYTPTDTEVKCND